jgi:hypothetical protein
MSRIALSGNPSGTGTFTLASPNSNADRTLDLPDQAGMVATSGISGVNSVPVGRGAGNVASNTAVGASALAANTTGTENQAFGAFALDANTTGNSNSAFGLNALGANTTASNNSAYGVNSLRFNTTGPNNVAVGADALENNTVGENNTALGFRSLRNNTAGRNNTAIGRQALTSLNLVTGHQAIANTAVGSEAGLSLTTGNGNTLIGQGVGNALTTGSKNTFIGGGDQNTNFPSGFFVTTGSSNTILGNFSGNQGGLDIRTANNNIVLSDGDGNPRETFTGDGRRVYQQSSGGRGAFEGWVDWANVSSITFDLTALFPTAAIVGQGLNIILQIVTQASGNSTSAYYVMASRNVDGGNWQFTTMASQVRGATVTFTGGSGGVHNITLTFSIGSQFGKCMIRGVSNG